MKLILALCGAALIAGCASVPPMTVQKVESNQACDYALMAADPDRSVLGELPAGPAQHQQDVLIAAPRSAAPRRGSR